MDEKFAPAKRVAGQKQDGTRSASFYTIEVKRAMMVVQSIVPDSQSDRTICSSGYPWSHLSSLNTND